MRTTVRLSEELLTQAKKKALRDGTTFTALVERGLRLVLDPPKPPQAERKMPRVSSVSGRQLVDTTKTSELLDTLDEQLPLEKRR
jgi:hypothetical protein